MCVPISYDAIYINILNPFFFDCECCGEKVMIHGNHDRNMTMHVDVEDDG